MALEINEQNFEQEVLKSDIPVVIDFWAEWCAPCQMIVPIIEKLSKAYRGTIKFGKVDVDHNQKLARQYQIMSIPQLVFFKNGAQVDSIVGAVPEAAVREKVESLFRG